MTDKKQEVYINKINELKTDLTKDLTKVLPEDLTKKLPEDFSKVLTKDLLFYYDLYYNNKLDNNDKIKKIIINIIELYKLLFTIIEDSEYKELIDMLIFNQQLYLSLIDLDESYESDELKNKKINEKYLEIKEKMNNLNQFNKIKYLNLLCTYQNINI